jgi:hypothetical protein
VSVSSLYPFNTGCLPLNYSGNLLQELETPGPDTPYMYANEMNIAESSMDGQLIAVRRNPEHPGLAFSRNSGESWMVPTTVEKSISASDCKPGIVSLPSLSSSYTLVISTPWSPMNVPANNMSLSVSTELGSAGSWVPRVSFGGSVDYSSLCNVGDCIGVLFEVPNTNGYISGQMMDWDLAFQCVNASLLSPDSQLFQVDQSSATKTDDTCAMRRAGLMRAKTDASCVCDRARKTATN